MACFQCCLVSTLGIVIILSLMISTKSTDGISLNKRLGRLKIVQGENVVRYRSGKFKWEWQALILVKKHNQVSTLTLCGGSLIHPNWVLTAAHCVEQYSKIKVYFGVWNVSNRLEVGRSVHVASEVIPHPCYDETSWNGFSGYNVALIKLGTPNYRFKFICANGGSEDWRSLLGGHTLGGCIATGYGVTDTDKDATILQEVEFSNVSKKTCTQYGEIAKGNEILCASDEFVTGKDTCKGDMGGPLVCPTSKTGCSGFYLAGVTLAGSSTCGEGKPGIYAAVYPNLEWIYQEMNEVNYTKSKRRGYSCIRAPVKASSTSSNLLLHERLIATNIVARDLQISADGF